MDPATVVVVASVDEAYVMPLAVMIRSALENLRPGTALELFVLEDSTTPESRRRAERSWDGFPIRVRWITPDKEKIEGRLQDRGHAGVPATYFRLLVGDLLPSEVRKAIYLDVDMIVSGDLGQLWDLELEGHLALAVPDAYFDLYHRARLEAVALSGESPVALDCYFNAGVLVVDVEGWRKEAVGPRALAIAERHNDALTFHDQDALNLVLRGRWGALAAAWNFHELFDGLMYWDRRQYRREDVAEAFRNPKIIHFIGPTKPWMGNSGSVYTPRFLEYLARTGWSARDTPRPGLLGRLVAQHGRLNWLVWRGVVHDRDGKRIAAALGLSFTRPWLLLTYPLWQASAWAYFALARVGRWARRVAARHRDDPLGKRPRRARSISTLFDREQRIAFANNICCDEGHLGGYIRSSPVPAPSGLLVEHGDPATYTPALWRWAHDTLGIRSVLDVGCGEGHCARFFRDLGCHVLGVDGSREAKRSSRIRDVHVVHDFVEGPYLPEHRFDLVWCCEFVEHVEEQHCDNFLATFRASRRFVLLTHALPGQRGWHHVNCRPQRYWVDKLATIGFEFDPELTAESRRVAEPGHYRDHGLVFVRGAEGDSRPGLR